MIQCELDFGISEDGFQNSGQKEHFEFQNESQQETNEKEKELADRAGNDRRK